MTNLDEALRALEKAAGNACEFAWDCDVVPTSVVRALLTTRQEVAPVAWMPIDSAPRDGSWIVLVNAKNGESATAKSAGPEFKTLPDYEWIQWPYINGQPTHWMHCPKETI